MNANKREYEFGSRELLAVGIFSAGSQLGERIEMLLRRGRKFSARVSMSRVAISAVAVLVLAAAGSRTPRWIAFAQPAPRPAFEVASVKRNVSGDVGRYIRPSPGRLSITNMSLKNLVTFAYEVRDFQISGGPTWLDSDQFDIEAKPADASGSWSQMEGPMLQALLEDRFKLTVHRETKELPIYILTAPKGAASLHLADKTSCVKTDPGNPPLPSARGRDLSEACGFLGMGQTSLDARQVTLADLTMALSQVVGRKVVDKTGLTGEIDAHLIYSPEDAPDARLPSIFTAIQEQLGLRLESSRGPVEVLVIDRAEKPTEN